ncbi:MAG: hypothetical protein ONB31_00615 [candidate division KSB1 bacterium]|nr:hypothetical protein [candidate division KSB1 bacterium]MDZ7334479.1 hypothetical protein [candidate division KSB1 bacterium]MDZ7356006.1 hypothetical protein [candidate division KSB1 bacterium]MDZ7400660.1 hypothetical protein [candidate division KSB1 bacterium]
MRKRIAKKILKNQGLLSYTEQQIKKAQKTMAKFNQQKEEKSSQPVN